MDAEVTAGVETEVETERGVVVFSKVIFFFFRRCSISVGIIEDFIIVIFSALEILALEVGLIYY